MMNTIIRATFGSTVDFLQSELEVMPLSRWSESVLRYYFCRFLTTQYPDVEQFVECGKIDLVLVLPPERAFIEFKFYRHPRRYDPVDGSARGFKGGPGRKNLGEFQACVDLLHDRPSPPGLSKYIVLVYADPTDGSRPRLRFSNQYGAYRHSRDEVAISRLESRESIPTGEGTVWAHLYEVGAAQR